jgi:hypothetical protein
MFSLPRNIYLFTEELFLKLNKLPDKPGEDFLFPANSKMLLKFTDWLLTFIIHLLREFNHKLTVFNALLREFNFNLTVFIGLLRDFSLDLTVFIGLLRELNLNLTISNTLLREFISI